MFHTIGESPLPVNTGENLCHKDSLDSTWCLCYMQRVFNISMMGSVSDASFLQVPVPFTYRIFAQFIYCIIDVGRRNGAAT